MTTKTITITVDFEHNCETWWVAARAEARGNPPSACIGLLESVNTLTVSEEDAAEFVAWAKAIPGWSEQPFVIQ